MSELITTQSERKPALSRVDGRSDLLSAVDQWIKSDLPILGLEGIGGSGKTHLLLAIGEECQNSLGCVHIEIDIGQIQNTPQLVSRLVSALSSESPSIDAKSIVQTIKGVGVNQVKRAIFALVSDAAAKVRDSVPNLMNELESATSGLVSNEFSMADLNNLENDNQLYLVTEYLHVLGEMGIRAAITIDGCEIADPEVVKTIQLIMKQAPKNWKIAIASNIELSAESPWAISVRPILKAEGGTVLTLADLTDEDLASWYTKETGDPPTVEDLAQLVRLSQRRAKRVHELLKNPQDLNADNAMSNYNEIQALRRGKLSKNAKCVGDILSFATPDKVVSCDLLEKIYDQSTDGGFSDALLELKTDGFLLRSGEGVRISHSSTHVEWRESLSSGESDRLAERIESVIGNSGDGFLFDPNNRGMIEFSATTTISSGSASELYLMGKSLLEAGETGAGIRVLNSGAAGGGQMNTTSSDHLEQALLLASTNLALGRYAEVVPSLVAAETYENKSETQKIKTNLLRLKHCLRTNQYDTLFALGANIRDNFGDIHDAQLERAMVENTAARDLLDYETIQKTSLEIEDFKSSDVSDELRCSLYRTLARSLAKLGKLPKAEDFASQAIDLAKKLDGVRALGNSFFAAGEVARYQKDHSTALSYYDKAISLAEGTNNRDALLWALLAKGFAFLEKSSADCAEPILKKLQSLLSEDGFYHPIEGLHTELMKLMINTNPSEGEVNSLISRYDELGVSWPAKFIPQMINDGISAAIPI